MRKKIVAGNWKMNLTWDDSQALAMELAMLQSTQGQSGPEMILAPAFPNLVAVAQAIKGAAGMHLAAQNVHQAASGAYTGEVSVSMLKSVSCTHAIIGHSERRQYFGESNQLLAQKINSVLQAGLTPIYCFGETLEEREGEKTFKVIESQLREATFHLNSDQFSSLILAYEPVWAIGTGKTATPEQAQEVHAFVRKLIADQFGTALADGVSILYGGSVKADNAKELFSQPDIDGGLVGGASLKASEFAAIARSF
ncbi:MAG: triose-phosphate isomerase [Bacteroidia bacterium]|nr:triose-phosphate isomerase [Bacteroidia bacterium]